MGDLHSLVRPDGLTLMFPDEEHRFLVYGNYGAPNINYLTRRGYLQDGATELDYTIDIRTIAVALWKAPACDRVTYWQNRAYLHDFLRPNLGGPLEFILTIPDGSRRALMVRPSPGLVFPINADDNAWHVDEPVEFVAFDPIWFDPGQVILAAAAAADQELVFPIDFPIWFGSGGSIYEASFTYTGTWESFPTLTITGPYTSLTLETSINAAAIYMTVPISVGDTRIITLDAGNISIVDQNGVDKFGELGPNSNLVDFFIAPDPIAPGGVQSIRATIPGQGATTTFEISYYDRYFAI